MCDSFVMRPPHSRNHSVIMGKNSDREPEEAQAIEWVPRTSHTKNEVKCTFITIPQVLETNEILLSRPFQMWGAEMGMNEHNVCIGNEALFTRIKFDKSNSGLTGMDMVRIALERSRTSREALECIQNLLAEHGQDACGGYKNTDFFYHNSFLISDTENSFILETAGKSWAWKKVRGFGSISNIITLGTDYDDCHIQDSEMPRFSFSKPDQPIHFRKVFSDYLYTRLGRGKQRRACTLSHLSEKAGNFGIENAFDILKTHHLADNRFTPQKANTADICMHAKGKLNPSSTTGSMVAEIRKENPTTVWLTGTSYPCLSVYIPFFMPAGKLPDYTVPGSEPDNSLWWKAQKLHSWVCRDYQNRKTTIQQEIATMQQKFCRREAELIRKGAGSGELVEFSSSCLEEVFAFYSAKYEMV